MVLGVCRYLETYIYSYILLLTVFCHQLTRMNYYNWWYDFCVNVVYDIMFSRPTNFLQKSSCRVSSEKNILNSSVEWSRVEWKNWIKVISLFTFSHIFCLLSILSYEARMIIDIHTCVIRKSQSLTYCFLFININTVTRGAHDIRTWYPHVRSMGISNFNLLCRLMGVRIIDLIFSR